MDFTFLNEDQIWGDDALEVIKRYGTKVAPTDLTAILGGVMIIPPDYTGSRTSEGDLTCPSWSASSTIKHDAVRCVGREGETSWSRAYSRKISARPVLPPSEASKISPSEAWAIDGIRVAEYGEYPQTVADKRTSEKLEKLHSSSSLRLSGKNYTFDSRASSDDYWPFKATSYPEYEMDGKRYIRVLGHPYNDNSKLSTGERVKKRKPLWVGRKPYWVEVQPIEWLMDPSGIMVAKKCLFAGIQFRFMQQYLDTYFAKEMEPTGRVAARTEPVKKKEPPERVAARTLSRDDEEEGTRTIRSTIRRFGKSR